MKYRVIVDNELIDSSNSLRELKKRMDRRFEEENIYDCKIVTGKIKEKIVASKVYDGKWHLWS